MSKRNRERRAMNKAKKIGGALQAITRAAKDMGAPVAIMPLILQSTAQGPTVCVQGNAPTSVSRAEIEQACKVFESETGVRAEFQLPSDRPQPAAPCRQCPFARDVTDETLVKGGAPPEVYIGQARGPFMLPCHMDPHYDQKDCGLDQLQCAGAAVFRANCGWSDLMPPSLLRAEPDTEKVFANPAELLARHRRIPLDTAQERMAILPATELLRYAMAEARRSPKAKTIVTVKERADA